MQGFSQDRIWQENLLKRKLRRHNRLYGYKTGLRLLRIHLLFSNLDAQKTAWKSQRHDNGHLREAVTRITNLGVALEVPDDDFGFAQAMRGIHTELADLNAEATSWTKPSRRTLREWYQEPAPLGFY
jgi:hypothetical protein